jgi:hypothetical protein
MPRHGVVPSSRASTRSAAVSAAWASSYIRRFTCKACSPNAVPFLPGSNLLVAWNGATWSIRCQGTYRPALLTSTTAVIASTEPYSIRGGSGGYPSGSPAVAEAQLSTVVLEAGAAAAQAADLHAAADATVAAAAASAADESVVQAAHAKHMQDWYKCGRRHKPGRSSSSSSSCSGGSGSGGGSYVVAPWWPGQCIDCSVVGSAADPTGTFCSKCVML